MPTKWQKFCRDYLRLNISYNYARFCPIMSLNLLRGCYTGMIFELPKLYEFVTLFFYKKKYLNS